MLRFASCHLQLVRFASCLHSALQFTVPFALRHRLHAFRTTCTDNYYLFTALWFWCSRTFESFNEHLIELLSCIIFSALFFALIASGYTFSIFIRKVFDCSPSFILSSVLTAGELTAYVYLFCKKYINIY